MNIRDVLHEQGQKNSNSRCREKEQEKMWFILQHAIDLIFVLSLITFLGVDFIGNIMLKKVGDNIRIYTAFSTVSAFLQVIGSCLIGSYIGRRYQRFEFSTADVIALSVITCVLLYCTISWYVFNNQPCFDDFRISVTDMPIYCHSMFVQFLYAKVANRVIGPTLLGCDLFFICTHKNVKEGKI